MESLRPSLLGWAHNDDARPCCRMAGRGCRIVPRRDRAALRTGGASRCGGRLARGAGGTGFGARRLRLCCRLRPRRRGRGIHRPAGDRGPLLLQRHDARLQFRAPQGPARRRAAHHRASPGDGKAAGHLCRRGRLAGLPARLRGAKPAGTARRYRRGAAHLDRQRERGEHAFRPVGQYRRRRRGTPPDHPVPARPAGEPLYRAARSHDGRPAREHGRSQESGLRALSTLPEGA